MVVAPPDTIVVPEIGSLSGLNAGRKRGTTSRFE